MPIYHFTAQDQERHRVVDRIEASDADRARRLLEERGLTVLDLAAADSGSAAGSPAIELSARESGQVAEQVARLGKMQLPLAPGLRAVAEESDNPRLARALRWLAEQIEQGRSLEEAMASSQGLLPKYMTGLVAAAARTGQLGAVLSELTEHHRQVASLRGGILGALAYPLLVACLAMAILSFFIFFVVGGFESIFTDFNTRLPAITLALFWWYHEGMWLSAGLLVGLVILVALTRWYLGPANWQGLLARVPVIGPLFHLWALAEWFGLLGVLVRHEIAAPDALRFAADGMPNAHVKQLSMTLADGVSRGRSLSQVMATHRQIPASLAPVVRWGEKAGNLAESLGAVREILEERVRMRSFWLQTILPPCLFIAIGCGVFLVIGGLFMPLITLISHLSGGF